MSEVEGNESFQMTECSRSRRKRWQQEANFLEFLMQASSTQNVDSAQSFSSPRKAICLLKARMLYMMILYSGGTIAPSLASIENSFRHGCWRSIGFWKLAD